MTEQELIEAAAAEADRGGNIEFSLPLHHALALLGALQLALRHPHYREHPSFAMTGAIAHGLSAEIISHGGPAIRRIVELGWEAESRQAGEPASEPFVGIPKRGEPHA
jgi:hypothetical protein